MEARKEITDFLQDTLLKLKEETERLHRNNYKVTSYYTHIKAAYMGTDRQCLELHLKKTLGRNFFNCYTEDKYYLNGLTFVDRKIFLTFGLTL
ncbi:unnamed protein product [Callosobruchus maculatus]|uniref:Uncharacterized protein n=1 Tax=Callosobruchus maculatus TaxID=64391 RepID=A0A653DDQ2_CALMS|nr:unnamed protein product [Callosobruchus maculatus]